MATQLQMNAGFMTPMQQRVEASSPTDSAEDDSVWTEDVEEAFEEALAIYPPCGRRKIILSDEGKMYGRNELIARYIKVRTGKHRSRKQVSSHIQVLSRKKHKDDSSSPTPKTSPHGYPHIRVQGVDVSSSMSTTHSRMLADHAAYATERSQSAPSSAFKAAHMSPRTPPAKPMVTKSLLSINVNPAVSRPLPNISSHRIVMDRFNVNYSSGDTGLLHRIAYLNGSHCFVDPTMERVDMIQLHDKFPGLRDLYRTNTRAPFYLVKLWNDLSFDKAEGLPSQYMFSCRFESLAPLSIEVASQAVALGRPIAEKVQTEEPVEESGRFVYNFLDTPLCPFIVSFIDKLKVLPSTEAMNSVLENFTVVQAVRDSATKEVLFCTAYLFESSRPGAGPGHLLYKLVDDQLDAVFGRRYTS